MGCRARRAGDDGRAAETGLLEEHAQCDQALLPQALGTYVVDTLATANAVLQNTNCSNTQANNAVGCLAGHLLAAKLNLANGVSACIQATVVAADALLGHAPLRRSEWQLSPDGRAA